MTLFEGNLPQNNTERERERKKERTNERKKERKRASELDAKCYGNCRKQGTTGWISFIGLPVLWMCATVFAWFTPSLMDCRVWPQVIAFGGAYRFTVFRAHLWQKTPSLQRFWPWLTHMYIYIYACVSIQYLSYRYTISQWCKHVSSKKHIVFQVSFSRCGGHQKVFTSRLLHGSIGHFSMAPWGTTGPHRSPPVLHELVFGLGLCGCWDPIGHHRKHDASIVLHRLFSATDGFPLWKKHRKDRKTTFTLWLYIWLT